MSTRSVARLAFVVLLLASAAPASAQLCPGTADPCVIAVNTNVPSGTVLDIGTRGLVINPNVTLNVQGTGFFTVRSGSFTMESNAKIVAGGLSGFGGIVTVISQGPVDMKTGTLVDVRSANGGSFDVTANTGNLIMNGRVQADATAREGVGGDIAFTTLGGDITIAGLGLNANGGDRFAGGGSIFLDASGNALLTVLVQAKGSDGGTFEMFAGGNATVQLGATINLTALDVEFGDGGDCDMEAGGNVVFAGSILANASGDGPENGGGDGGFTDFLALGDVIVTGSIEARGSADGGGGDVDFDGTNVSVTGPIALTGPGQGDGGNLFVLSVQDAFLGSDVDVRAGISGGAFSFGGTVDVIADGDVLVGATAVLRTTGTFQAGTIDFFGCDVTVQNGAQLESLGPATATTGTNTVQASGIATIGGISKATTANRVRYREFMPVIAPQLGTAPAWTIAQNTALPCCIGCPIPTTTSTTTSTSSSSTSTTSTSSTTTTSTSLPGATTTTSTSSTSSTAPTTSSTVTSTTATSSTAPSTSSTSSTATTLVTTTTVEGSTTTTTSLPQGCDAFTGFEAAVCELTLLEADVMARSDDSLGGARSARGLRKRVEKSMVFLERASLETKLKRISRFVKRSRKKLQSFENKIVRFADKGKIPLDVAGELLAKAGNAMVQLEAIEVGLSQQ